MIVSGIEIHPYSLILKSAFHTSKSTITERKGFIISIKSKKGVKSFGDIAPLPEYGTETLEMAEDILLHLTGFSNNNFSNTDEIDNALSSLNNSPAVKHGLDQALVNLLASEEHLTLYELLGNKIYRREIKVNSVIGFSNPEENFNLALSHFESGFHTIKLKLGRDKFENEIELIKKIRYALGEEVKLRIDVNGAWKLNEAIDNLNKLEQFNIEYVEQPCSSLEELRAAAIESSIQIAVDESLRSYCDAQNIIEDNSIKILILKPMMLGGMISTQKIIYEAVKKGIKTIISSSFESVIGRKALVFLASLIKDDLAHGLGTDEYFLSGYENNPFPVRNGKIKISDPSELIPVENDF